MYKKVEPEPSPKPTPTIIVPTTTIRETIHKVRWTIRNLKALEKTGTKEIRSHIFPVYIDAGTRGRDKVQTFGGSFLSFKISELFLKKSNILLIRLPRYISQILPC